MKVLVTGGAGYIGAELVAALARRDEVTEIVVYDNLSRSNLNLFFGERLPDKPIRFVLGDILDSRTLREQLQGVDTVFHLAAKVLTPFSVEDPHSFAQVNHWGTAELSYAIEASEVSRLVYCSSTSVYGSSDEFFDESSSPNPRTAYGRSKEQGERMVRRLGDEREVLIARCSNVYGFGRAARFDAVINRFFFNAHYSNRVSIEGSGEQYRAFIHVDNAAAALARFGSGEIPAGTYNLVERNLNVNEIYEALAEIYPDLERIYIQQQQKVRSSRVKPDSRLTSYKLFETREFAEQLADCRRRFSFH